MLNPFNLTQCYVSNLASNEKIINSGYGLNCDLIKIVGRGKFQAYFSHEGPSKFPRRLITTAQPKMDAFKIVCTR